MENYINVNDLCRPKHLRKIGIPFTKIGKALYIEKSKRLELLLSLRDTKTTNNLTKFDVSGIPRKVNFIDINNPDVEGIYFLLCGNYVKIGKSKNILNRITSIQSANPFDLELLAIESDQSNELFFHNIFVDYHHKLEWFKIDKQTLLNKLGAL